MGGGSLSPIKDKRHWQDWREKKNAFIFFLSSMWGNFLEPNLKTQSKSFFSSTAFAFPVLVSESVYWLTLHLLSNWFCAQMLNPLTWGIPEFLFFIFIYLFLLLLFYLYQFFWYSVWRGRRYFCCLICIIVDGSLVSWLKNWFWDVGLGCFCCFGSWAGIKCEILSGFLKQNAIEYVLEFIDRYLSTEFALRKRIIFDTVT